MNDIFNPANPSEKVDSAYHIVQKATWNDMIARLREIYFYEELGLPAPPGLTEVECYEFAFELQDGHLVNEDGIAIDDRVLPEYTFPIS